MELDKLILSVNDEISWTTRRTEVLQKKKDKLLKLQDTYGKDAFLHRDTILCVNNNWDKVERMRIEPHYVFVQTRNPNGSVSNGYVRHIVLKFPISQEDGMKIFAYPFRTSVATVKYDFSAAAGGRKAEIDILDYTKLIPDACPKKERFVRRIQQYLLRHTLAYHYKVSDNSFGKETLQKWILLA